MQQSVGRIDHVAIVVKEESARPLAARLSDVLGVEFSEPVVNDTYGLLIIISWDSGLEIMAPTRPEGPYWDRIQRHGEGAVSIVFGVGDLDEGMEVAQRAGVDVPPEVRLNGDEPWLARFSRFREVPLGTLGFDMAATFTLSEIVPVPERG